MRFPWEACLLVGCGGFAGSVARYLLSLASQRVSIDWPLGTFLANVLGCLVIGIVMALSVRAETVTPEIRLALATGFCGGFTTMSSMIYETSDMARDSEYLHATLYTLASVFVSLVAFFVGITLVRLLFKMGGGLWS